MTRINFTVVHLFLSQTINLCLSDQISNGCVHLNLELITSDKRQVLVPGHNKTFASLCPKNKDQGNSQSDNSLPSLKSL